MKAKLIIASVLVANVIALWCLAHRYDFHTGSDGRIIWRCNNFTGKVEYCVVPDNTWVVVNP
jgi:hypothetical protein